MNRVKVFCLHELIQTRIWIYSNEIFINSYDLCLCESVHNSTWSDSWLKILVMFQFFMWFNSNIGLINSYITNSKHVFILFVWSNSNPLVNWFINWIFMAYFYSVWVIWFITSFESIHMIWFMTWIFKENIKHLSRFKIIFDMII